MSSLRRKKKIIQLSFVIVCLSVTAILVFCQIKEDTEDDTLKNIRVESIDKAIKISWKASLLTAIKTVVIETINSNNEICEVADVRPFWLSYEFKDGDIGERYHITVTAVYKDGRREELASEYRLLLDTDELPDLPTLYITTNSGNNPSTNHIDAPEGMWGSASVDNNAETGILVYKLKKSENKSIESRIRIAVRGNTSSIGEKEPYKIILDRAIDLIGTDDSSAHKEWLLLKSGTTLNNYVEQSLSEYCGMEWISQGTFVNVYLNGDWRGLYTLAEPVSQEASHDLVGKNGCIIENDAYWWNSNGIYFRLDGQIEQMAYTFKYPSIKSVEDDRFKNVKYFMQNLVDMSDDNDYNVWDFADIETFVAWLMVHDMVQCGDGGGTNIYYYINDFSAVEEEKQKIKM